ncbi:hypothetical protein ACFQLX_13345 [Streptomyces polyrhachis]|uniref:Sigma-like protein n=1 Tax=Streptomyces polyrhachis TaxID=1282885 RepID=A0ABW2GEF6_9ACTN
MANDPTVTEKNDNLHTPAPPADDTTVAGTDTEKKGKAESTDGTPIQPTNLHTP